jgi:hypothetical protein
MLGILTKMLCCDTADDKEKNVAKYLHHDG